MFLKSVKKILKPESSAFIGKCYLFPVNRGGYRGYAAIKVRSIEEANFKGITTSTHNMYYPKPIGTFDMVRVYDNYYKENMEQHSHKYGMKFEDLKNNVDGFEFWFSEDGRVEVLFFDDYGGWTFAAEISEDNYNKLCAANVEEFFDIINKIQIPDFIQFG